MNFFRLEAGLTPLAIAAPRLTTCLRVFQSARSYTDSSHVISRRIDVSNVAHSFHHCPRIPSRENSPTRTPSPAFTPSTSKTSAATATSNTPCSLRPALRYRAAMWTKTTPRVTFCSGWLRMAPRGPLGHYTSPCERFWGIFRRPPDRELRRRNHPRLYARARFWERSRMRTGIRS